MSFKEKVLSKSNSYNHYKKENKRLLEKIEKLENENLKLEEELDFLKNRENHIFKKKFANFEKTSSFCHWEFIEFYLNDEYEDKLKEVTKHLPVYARKVYKWYLLRAMVVNMIKRDSLYFSYELADQDKFTQFKLDKGTDDGIDGYKFTGDYNLHPFVKIGLSEGDLNYIKNKDIIDAGAFTGDTSLPLAKRTTKNVYAFEPFKESFEILEKNIKDNDISNIIPVNKSLGNINGERTLFLSGSNVQGITSDENMRSYDKKLTVQETTVDKFVEENKLNVGFITIDVEGAEMDLLEGAVNTIKTQKPILYISIYHKVSDYFDIIPWIANLDLGYEFNIVKENPWTFMADTIVQCRMKY